MMYCLIRIEEEMKKFFLFDFLFYFVIMHFFFLIMEKFFSFGMRIFEMIICDKLEQFGLVYRSWMKFFGGFSKVFLQIMQDIKFYCKKFDLFNEFWQFEFNGLFRFEILKSYKPLVYFLTKIKNLGILSLKLKKIINLTS